MTKPLSELTDQELHAVLEQQAHDHEDRAKGFRLYAQHLRASPHLLTPELEWFFMSRGPGAGSGDGAGFTNPPPRRFTDEEIFARLEEKALLHEERAASIRDALRGFSEPMGPNHSIGGQGYL